MVTHRKGFQSLTSLFFAPCNFIRQILQEIKERPREGKSLEEGHTARQDTQDIHATLLPLPWRLLLPGKRVKLVSVTANLARDVSLNERSNSISLEKCVYYQS